MEITKWIGKQQRLAHFLYILIETTNRWLSICAVEHWTIWNESEKTEKETREKVWNCILIRGMNVIDTFHYRRTKGEHTNASISCQFAFFAYFVWNGMAWLWFGNHLMCAYERASQFEWLLTLATWIMYQMICQRNLIFVTRISRHTNTCCCCYCLVSHWHAEILALARRHTHTHTRAKCDKNCW